MQIHSAANTALNYVNSSVRVASGNIAARTNIALADETAANTTSINTRNAQGSSDVFTAVGEPASAIKTGLYTNVASDPSSTNNANAQQPDAAAQEVEQKKEQAELALIQQQISELSARDKEVRAHEQAHMAAGGRYAGAAQYTYERGPDGVSYAVGGEVPIDVSPAATPQETIDKAQIVKRAALAPAEPSPQDRKVASLAGAMEQQARTELAEQNAQEQAVTRSEGSADTGENSRRDESNAFKTAQPDFAGDTGSLGDLQNSTSQNNASQSRHTISSSGTSSTVTQNNISTLLAIQSNQSALSTIDTRV